MTHSTLAPRTCSPTSTTASRPHHEPAGPTERHVRGYGGGLARMLAELEIDDAVGCVVLTGAGGAFCAGGDVKAMAERPAADRGRGPGRRHPPAAAGQRATSGRLWRCPSRRSPRSAARPRALACRWPWPVTCATRPPNGRADHRVRPGRVLRRLRRDVVPHPAGRQRKGQGAVLLLRPAVRGRRASGWGCQRGLPCGDFDTEVAAGPALAQDRGWPTAT